jgi:putative transposase
MTNTLCRVFVHLVWATHLRTPWLHDSVGPQVYADMAERCRLLDCTPLAVGGAADHVHLLVALSPRVAVASLVAKVKAPTTDFAQRRCGLEDFSWQTGYGAFSVGYDAVEAVVGYIQQQQAHHAQGSLRAEWEP